MKFALAETFTSIQGEGALTGKLMFFIRFAGCSVRQCPLHPSHGGLCDENWAGRWTLNKGDMRSLAKKAKASGAEWVCVTGGEPLDQIKALEELVWCLKEEGLYINLQTSGTKSIPAYVLVRVDFLTVSPKCLPYELKVTEGDELKVVYINQVDSVLHDYMESTNFRRYQLQPLWDGSDCTNMDAVITAIHRLALKGHQWDLSVQAHKLLGVQ